MAFEQFCWDFGVVDVGIFPDKVSLHFTELTENGHVANSKAPALQQDNPQDCCLCLEGDGCLSSHVDGFQS